MNRSEILACIIGVLLVVTLASCAEPQSTERTSNSDYDLRLLFEHDGCRVYRFYDSWHYRYFTDCRGSVSTRQSCGKSCLREENIETQR